MILTTVKQETDRNNNNNNNPLCNAPGASFTDPEAQRTLHDIEVRVDR